MVISFREFDVHGWIARLLGATSEADAHFEEMVNNPVVEFHSGSVSRGADVCVRLCLESIAAGVGSVDGIGACLDMVVAILYGEVSAECIEQGETDLIERCAGIVAEFSPVLIDLLACDDEYVVFGALELLWIVDPDKQNVVLLTRALDAGSLASRSPAIHRNLDLLVKEILSWTESPAI